MSVANHGSPKLEAGNPSVSVAQTVLLVLSQKGALPFGDIVAHPYAKNLVGSNTENSFYTALARLKKRNHVKRTTKKEYELTSIGQLAALKAFVRKGFIELENKFPDSGVETKKIWDGKWRLVFFDVPEKNRPVRDYMRSVLKRLGCDEFQRSIWIYPHKMPVFIEKLFDEPAFRKYARIITTYDIDYDSDLRRKFKLS